MIKIAVIGVGRWGVNLLRNFLQHPQVKVMAVVDPNQKRLVAVKQQYNLQAEVILTTQWQEIRQIADLEAVVIATPAETHYSLIANALEWGYHVLAEKPLTLNPKECQELCELAEKQHLVLMVDHTYLFHRAVEGGQAIVNSGKLGNLRYGFASRTNLGPVRQDVDALWDLAIHDIAIFNTWLGQMPIEVQASGTVWLQNEGKGLADLVWVTLTYPDSFKAYIHLCWLNPDKQRRLGVVGSRGCLVFDEIANAPLTLIHGEFEVNGNQFIPVNQNQEIIHVETDEPLKRVCCHFVECIHNQISIISSGWVGVELVQILTALTISLNQGGQSVAVVKS